MFTNTPHPSATSRIAVVGGAEPADWQSIYDRIAARANTATVAMTNAFAACITLVSLFAGMAALGWCIWQIYPSISLEYMACFVVPPAFLLAAAAGQAGGNLFLRYRFGLDQATRRGFAARLTLGRAPEQWPGLVRRWLFTGDWLGKPACDQRMPYMRIFVLGNPPETCSQEDAIWQEVHDVLCGEDHLEAGCNHREICYPTELPEWSRHIGKGDGLDSLRQRIGTHEADEWVSHLWRRAHRQWPAIGMLDTNAGFHRDCFELHRLALPGGLEGLVVILRPFTKGEKEETSLQLDQRAA